MQIFCEYFQQHVNLSSRKWPTRLLILSETDTFCFNIYSPISNDSTLLEAVEEIEEKIV